MKPIDPGIEALIIALRDSRRRHLEARLARDTITRQKGKDDERAIEFDRAASTYYYDCEELVWRLRFTLAAASPGPVDPLEPETPRQEGNANRLSAPDETPRD